MKRALVLPLVLLALPALAEEGMWQPHQLPALAPELRALGLRIDPARLSDLTEHPMNAVISLGGCTASFVSPDGLVVTNHHCAFGAIQYNSTPERNLLKDGFLARERPAELFAGPGSRVLVTVELTDVTGRVLGSLPEGASGRARYQAIEDREKELIAACEADAGHRCRVAAFHGGLEYYLMKELEIRDVRLVYAPAGSIGKYGGDVDNWMWPRHTGDFSFYRAYVGPDGKPADHDAANVPFQPKHWLRVAARGLAEGDFVMVAGYPGRTNRYRLAEEVESTIEWSYPTRRALFLEMLGIIEAETRDHPDAAIKYASTVASLNNSTKNYQGMLDGFAHSDIVERKRAEAAKLQTWIAQGGEMREQYRTAVEELRALVLQDLAHRDRDLYYGMAQRSALLSAASQLTRLAVERQKPDAAREPGYQDRDVTRIRESLTRIDRRYDPRVDRAIWAHFIERYAALDADQQVAAFDEYFGVQGGKVDAGKLAKKLDRLYEKTRLGDPEARLAWMEKTAEEIRGSDDPFLQLAVHLLPSDLELEEDKKEIEGRFQELRPRAMAALIAFLEEQGKSIYADANGTLRVTYGTVKGYRPRDGVSYTPFTTLAGIVEKDTGVEPFDSPQPLLDAIGASRLGPYREPGLGSVPVNFLSTVDTTGGNSGSPTLNGDAELVGLLFDGNYESINADWDFNEAIARSIHVDIRYALWIIDEIDGAGELLREMGVAPAHAAGD